MRLKLPRLSRQKTAAPRRARPCEAEVTIERLIVVEGRSPDDFLCQDCHTWVIETHYCGCWDRHLFRAR